jgi:hypothetical protein
MYELPKSYFNITDKQEKVEADDGAEECDPEFSFVFF